MLYDSSNLTALIRLVLVPCYVVELKVSFPPRMIAITITINCDILNVKE